MLTDSSSVSVKDVVVSEGALGEVTAVGTLGVVLVARKLSNVVDITSKGWNTTITANA